MTRSHIIRQNEYCTRGEGEGEGEDFKKSVSNDERKIRHSKSRFLPLVKR